MKATIKGSIYSRKGSPYLWVAYYDPQGRRRTVSTKTNDKKKAKDFLKNLDLGIKTDSYLDPQHKTTMVNLYDLIHSDYVRQNRKSIDDLESRWRLHIKPEFGHLKPSQVTTARIDEYANARKTQGAANGSINRDLCVIRRMFYLAQENKLVRDIPKINMWDETQSIRKGFIEPEMDALLRQEFGNCGLFMLGLYVCYTTYGCRKDELLSLRIRHVDFLGKKIRLEETKNGEQRLLPLIDHVTAILKQLCQGKSADDFVFTRDNGKPVRSFRGIWEQVMVKVGLGKFHCPICNKGRGHESKDCHECGHRLRYTGILVHDCRRTAARHLVHHCGLSEGVAQRLLGHRTRSMFDRYAVSSTRDLDVAGERLNDFEKNRFNNGAVAQKSEPKNEEEPVIN